MPLFKNLCSLMLLGLISFTTLLFAQQKSNVQLRTMPYDAASVPRERMFDFEHLRLNVSFKPEQGEVTGKVTHIFRVLRPTVDSMVLDAPDIRIERIMMGASPLKFRTSDKYLTIALPRTYRWDERDSLTIDYSAKPRKGLYFIGWNDPAGKARKQIWTQGQGEDNRFWIPMYDQQNDKITTDITVRMAKGFEVLSNGILIQKTSEGNDILWHYRMQRPHASYLIMLGIGDYVIRELTSKSGVKSRLYMYPDKVDCCFETTYRYSADMIDFFEKEIGVAYPWEQYSQIPVQEFLYGAMENTTATVFGDFFICDQRGYADRNYVSVNAHELAHQWFGDLVTARTATHHWLQESFATHYNWLYEREVFGQTHFDNNRRGAQNAALRASQKDFQPIASSEAGSTRWYPKGAFVLEMIKHVVGRDAYNRAIKHYLEKHAYDNVDSEDLLIAFHESLGYSLDWFWDQWVYRGGEPHFKVEKEIKADETRFTVKQVQDTGSGWVGLFKMPIAFQVWYEDGTCDSLSMWIEQNHHEVVVPNQGRKKVAFTLFDPNNQVLKQITFEKPFDELARQASNARHMLDRLDAIIAMKEIDWKIKAKVVSDVLNKREYYTIKEAALEQAKKAPQREKDRLFTQAIRSSDRQVRRASLALWDTLPKSLIDPAQKLLNDTSYAVQTLALVKLCEANPSEAKKYLAITSAEKNPIFRIEWLKYAIKNGQDECREELISNCSPSHEFRSRTSAISAAVELGISNKEFLAHALDAAYSPNNRLSQPSINQLKKLMEKDANVANTLKLLALPHNELHHQMVKEKLGI